MLKLRTPIRTKIALLAGALLSSAAYADVRSDMMELWTGRAATYEGQKASNLQQREIAISALAEVKSDEDARTGILKAYDATFTHGYSTGRAEALSHAREFFRKKRSAGAAEIWMQDQVSEMKQAAQEARSKLEATKDFPDSMGLTAKLNATLAAIGKSGIVRGQIDELNLLDGNMASYYRAKNGEEQARREARSRIFGALAAAFTPPDDRSIHVTCRQSMLGTTVQCTGNDF